MDIGMKPIFRYETDTPESYQTDTDTNLKFQLQTDTDTYIITR